MVGEDGGMHAMNAAKQMQHQISTGNLSGDEGVKVSIRIGCHFGPVVVEERDIFGAAVATANRMTSQAKAGQIITTESTVNLLNQNWQRSLLKIVLRVKLILRYMRFWTFGN